GEAGAGAGEGRAHGRREPRMGGPNRRDRRQPRRHPATVAWERQPYAGVAPARSAPIRGCRRRMLPPARMLAALVTALAICVLDALAEPQAASEPIPACRARK